MKNFYKILAIFLKEHILKREVKRMKKEKNTQVTIDNKQLLSLLEAQYRLNVSRPTLDKYLKEIGAKKIKLGYATYITLEDYNKILSERG